MLRYSAFRRNAVEPFHSALTHAGFVVSRSTCEAALARAWSERDAVRFNKGAEGRGKNYFSPRHIADLSRKLSFYPQLEDWMPELMGAGAALREAS